MKCPSLPSFPLIANNETCPGANAKANSSKKHGLTVFSDGELLKDPLSSMLLKPVTKTIQKLSRNKRTYVNTSNKVRFELIDAVHKHGQKIKDAAQKLGINYSAAKAICQVYKKEGRGERKVVKIRKNKKESKALNPDTSIVMDRAGIELIKTKEIKQEFILEKLELSTEGCKNESISDQEITDKISFQRVLSQNLKEEEKEILQKAYQTLNLNGLATAPSCTFSSAQGVNIISTKDLLPIKLQPGYDFIPNTSFSSIQPQQILISNIINSSLPTTSLNLYTLNTNNGYLLQNLQHATLNCPQDPTSQNFNYQLMAHGTNSNHSLLKQTGLYSAMNQDFKFNKVNQDQFINIWGPNCHSYPQ